MYIRFTSHTVQENRSYVSFLLIKWQGKSRNVETFLSWQIPRSIILVFRYHQTWTILYTEAELSELSPGGSWQQWTPLANTRRTAVHKWWAFASANCNYVPLEAFSRSFSGDAASKTVPLHLYRNYKPSGCEITYLSVCPSDCCGWEQLPDPAVPLLA